MVHNNPYESPKAADANVENAPSLGEPIRVSGRLTVNEALEVGRLLSPGPRTRTILIVGIPCFLLGVMASGFITFRQIQPTSIGEFLRSLPMGQYIALSIFCVLIVLMLLFAWGMGRERERMYRKKRECMPNKISVSVTTISRL